MIKFGDMDRNFRSTLILTCCLFTGLFNFASGQDLHFEQLDARQGLPAMECYNLLQDKTGYIWVFTEYGIVKHNGEKFVPTCTNISLKDQNAYAVFQTDQGEIYFANSFAKIYHVQNDSAIVIPAIEKFTENFREPDQIIFQLMVDPNKDIYFSTFKTTYVYNHAENKVKEMNALPKGPASIHFKKNGNDFFGIRRSLAKAIPVAIDVDGDSSIHPDQILPSVYTRMHLEKLGNHYYLENGTSIEKIGPEGIISTKEVGAVIKFRSDNKNNLWVLCYEGIFVLDANLNILWHYLPNVIVSDICFDNQNGLWVTTIGQGVFHCRNKEELEYNYTNMLYNGIFFLKKTGNSIYFSSIDGGCYRLKDNQVQKLHQFTITTHCTDITEYGNNLLFSTKKGLFIKNESTGNITEMKKTGNAKIYALGSDVVTGNIVVKFGGSAAETFRANGETNYCDFHSKICSYKKMNKNTYLVGLKQGLVLFNFEKNTAINCHPFFADKYISALEFDPDSNLWIGTQGDGLYMITKEHQVARFLNAPFFVITDIRFFGNHKIIISTNIGVFINTYDQTAITSNWINIVDLEVSAIEIMNDRLWIASSTGLYSRNLNELYWETNFPIIIHSIHSNSKKVLTPELELDYNENNLKFDFDFLNFQKSVNRFYFDLSGPTQLSGTIDGDILQIQNLKPGTYTLRVFPLQGPLRQNHFVSKTFTIRPAFWQVWWFKPLVILLIVLVTAFSVALYFSRRQKMRHQKEGINKLLAEYKLTALKAQINPHFISNSLSAIQRLIESGEVDKANQYLAKFSLLIRYVLKYSDKSIAKLGDELKVMDLNVELEQLRFNHSFEYIKQVADDVNTEAIYIPPLITQPFIENAIWHGLLPLKNIRPPKLIFKVEKINDCLLISIIDNGVGRITPATNQTGNGFGVHESRGTSLINNRMESMNKFYNSSVSAVSYIDLTDEHGDPAGTQVNILLSFELLDKLYEKQYEGFNN
jgi:ligand-binding sensor domain-containing protein